MAQWIRHPPTKREIAGSSPVEDFLLLLASHRNQTANDSFSTTCAAVDLLRFVDACVPLFRAIYATTVPPGDLVQYTSVSAFGTGPVPTTRGRSPPSLSSPEVVPLLMLAGCSPTCGVLAIDASVAFSIHY